MGDLIFLSTSHECSKLESSNLASASKQVVSMFDKTLTVPDVASAVQLEQRVRAKVQTPYNAAALRAKSKDKQHQIRMPQM